MLPALCTVAIVTVSAADEVTIWSAGHPLPLLRRGTTVTQVGRTSPMLGVQDGLPVLPLTVPVLPGDQLVLYTDGVIDATGPDGRFGEERLAETLSALKPADAADVARRVLASIDAFAVGEQADDIAILALERRTAGAQRNAAA